ncbi:MAG: InlB B-repeat-containing protein [Lachnospiraceae bacterium]|nr:InlB B-repeat-containing protein [Lachnospiraceae bacterium]
MRKFLKGFLCMLALCFFLTPVTSHAAASTGEMAQFPNVTLSPDGTERAWTTDWWDKTNERLPWRYTVDMNAESSIGNLGDGEHYYGKQAVGSVTVGKWVVMHTPGQCIHDTPTKDTFAGFDYRNEICHSYYNNGWFAYCADCGEIAAHMLIYARESTVKQITSIPASSIYVYQCPHCSHLEQGSSYQHYCKAISSNRYKVTYRQNAPADNSVAGYMAPTMHMYGNSDSYNGEPVSEIGYTDTALRKNSYVCNGYLFAGWNTKADGSGVSFRDGQEVLNLTTEDNGIVKLYAQWVKAEGSLLLDANGGTYKGQSVYTQKQKYGTSYQVENGQLVPPTGYRVEFVTNGGNAVQSIITTKSFTHWEVQPDFSGEFKNNVYKYLGDNGNVDRLKAQYVNNSFKLPNCTGNNVSLVGWYDDPGLGDDAYMGKQGDEITVEKNTILYAKWATLTLWAYDDYTSHGGVGAVDLKWEQKDGKGKYYRLYQSENQTSWKEIFSGNDIQSDITISKEYGTSNQGTTYTIPYTGNYTLTAYGARGADYNGTYVGGNGGIVTATYWLNKGDILTVYPGMPGSGLYGGTNGNGANGGSSSSDLGRGGGAATQIYLTRNGSKHLLITAGGGGGANAGNSGGNGGTGGGNNVAGGANGVGAGGGGYSGGLSGAFSYHSHSDTCGYHTHTGNTSSGGICYNPKVCGGNLIQTSEREIGGWYGHWDEDGSGICIQCGYNYGLYGNEDVHAWYYGEDEWTCQRCGGTTDDDTGSCRKTTYYLSCELTEGWQCGKTKETVDSLKASVGGTSYAVSDFGCKGTKMVAGGNGSSGKVSVQSVDVGYMEVSSLADVLARDKAAPGKISDYTETLSGEDICRITVVMPEDFGTTYYHKVESFEAGTVKKLATSNITENNLVSGVSGYRYFVSGSKTGTVTESNSFTRDNRVDVRMTTSVQYLHIAAVDVAGNIGATAHIEIKTLEEVPDIEPDDGYIEDVPLKTEQVLLEDTEYVYPAGTGKYYVKADGETEHTLKLAGYTDGKASNHYQIDWLRMVSLSGVMEEWYQTKVPRVSVETGNAEFANEELTNDASDRELRFLEPSSAVAWRSDEAEKVGLSQKVVIGAGNDGKQITVYPRAIAEFESEEYWSDQTEDRSHGLILIPDGKSPVFTGIEALQNAGNIDMTEEKKDFIITATDEGSGMRELIVIITNLDNQMQRTYESDSGELVITIEKDDYLFLGDFVVSAEASDNVGNVNLQGSDSLAFTMEADLKRAREPQSGDFRAGDGAILTITTGGYADKIIVRFPEELIRLNPELNQEYVYEFPEAIKTEMYEFNIPLATPGGMYVIEVVAWKDNRKLTEELALPIRTSGSIIDELRTRIRDNGV